MSDYRDDQPKRRRIPPRPVGPLFDHPDAMRLTSAGYGVISRILDYWWLSGCKPLPDSSELFKISRSHSRIWAQEKAVIDGILRDIMPPLAKYYESRLKRRSILLEIGRDSHFRARAKANREKAATDKAKLEAATLPIHDPRAVFRMSPDQTTARPKRRD